MFNFGIKADHFVASLLYLRRNRLIAELTKLLNFAHKFPIVSDDTKYHLAHCNLFAGRRAIALELLADFDIEDCPPRVTHLWLDVMLDTHQFEKVSRLFDATIAKGKNDPEIEFRQAIALYSQGDHESCQKILDSIDADFGLKPTIDRLQSRLHFYNDRYEQAAKIAISYLNDPQSDLNYFYQYYYILICTGHIDKAMELLRRRPRPTHPKSLQGKPSAFEIGPLKGKTIYIASEQGIGDRVEFARYYAKATQLGIKLKTRHPAKMIRLFNSMTSSAEQIPKKIKADEIDSFLGMACLPALVDVKTNVDMQSLPYLKAETYYADRWRARLPKDKPLIGITWKGSDLGWLDYNRSIPLKAFLPLLQRDDINVVCLQIDQARDEINEIPSEHRPIVFDDLDAGKDAYVDTVGLISNLDLVVSSDTSMAHVAGAMGAPSTVLLGKHPDYRWLIDDRSDFLYQNQNTIRQTTFGDWDTPISELNEFINATLNL